MPILGNWETSIERPRQALDPSTPEKTWAKSTCDPLATDGKYPKALLKIYPTSEISKALCPQSRPSTAEYPPAQLKSYIAETWKVFIRYHFNSQTPYGLPAAREMPALYCFCRKPTPMTILNRTILNPANRNRRGEWHARSAWTFKLKFSWDKKYHLQWKCSPCRK